MSVRSRSIQTGFMENTRGVGSEGEVCARITHVIDQAFRFLTIQHRTSHREKAAARFSWALSSLLLSLLSLCAAKEAMAGTQDELFWQDVGGVAAPFQPVEILPLEREACFIPATGDVDTLQGISFSYQAANHRYQLDGLWNDQGTTLHLLEDRGLTQEDYIQRFGFPAGRSDGGYTLKDSQNDIRFLYRANAHETALTEPKGYGSYQWEKSSDGKSYVTIDAESARSPCFQPESFPFGTTYFRCIATAAEETFTLGENYAISYYRLPSARGLRIREVPHAG